MKLTVGCLLFFCYFPVSAQQAITLEQAQKIASENSLLVQNSLLLKEYQRKLEGSYLDIPQAAVTGEYGRINGLARDYKVGISQDISFPTVYSRKKELLHQQWNEAVLHQNMTNIQLDRRVSEVFYQLLILEGQQKLLLRVDSLFAAFLEKTMMRLELGESNILEKTSADIQRSQIRIQLKELKTSFDITLLEFQLLLNTEERYVPLGPLSADIDLHRIDLQGNPEHPELQLLQQKISISEAETRWEKSKYLPGISVGYAAHTMQEINDALFHSVQIGIRVPIATKSQRALISASRQKTRIAENEYAYQLSLFNKRLQEKLTYYYSHKEIIRDYQEKQLPNAELIFETAEKQFSAGEIDYLQWIVLHNQAIMIQSSYFEALQQYNQSITELNYILNSNK